MPFARHKCLEACDIIITGLKRRLRIILSGLPPSGAPTPLVPEEHPSGVKCSFVRTGGQGCAMDRRDWILLALSAANDDALSPVQLQKALFLFGEEKKDLVSGPFYTFSPYAYGPFDKAVYKDAEALTDEGFIVSEATPYGYPRYSLTPLGLGHAGRLARFEKLREEFTPIVSWTKGLSFSQLVSAIYKKYPHMQANSVFR